MTDKHMPITGGCSCGSIRYESTAPPVNGGFCHCTQCQRESGGLYVALLMLPQEGFQFIQGVPARYSTTAALSHLFCANCGSSIGSEYFGDENIIVTVGTLDHPEDWPLNQEGWFGHVYVANKIPWEVIGDGLPQHDQEAPELEDKMLDIQQRAQEKTRE